MVHSEEYLDDVRYDWYNKDFLDLMAKRWALENVSILVDVGCGLCHWNRLLIDYLKKPAQVIGIDFEKKWIDDSYKYVDIYKKKKIDLILKNENAENISLPDNYCDVITCQTLLIHVNSIESVLNEFYRVLKTNGKIIIAEPNNLVNSIVIDSIEVLKDMDYFKNKSDFELAYAFGKGKLNEGKSYSVESIPNILHKLGYKNIQVYLSDKVFGGFIDKFDNEFEDIKEADYEKSKRYLLSAGTDLSIHNKYWEGQKKYFEEKMNIVNSNGIYDCKGSLMYLISAEKS